MLNRIKTLAVVGAVTLAAAAGPALANQAHGMGQCPPGAAQCAPGEGQMMGQGFGPGAMLHQMASKLGLTSEQKAQLKAIARKYRGQFKPAERKVNLQALHDLLLAKDVNGPALKVFLDSHLQQFEKRMPAHIAMLKEMRAVLTDAQRQKLAAMINQAPPKMERRFKGMHQAMAKRLLAGLNLNPKQQAAFDALQAKLEAMHASGAPAKLHQAFANFVLTGDDAALRAARPHASSFPIDEFVAFNVSLDQHQRTILVHRFERMHRMMMRHMHHGMGW